MWFSKKAKKLLFSHAKAWACAEAWNSPFNLWISHRPKTHKQYSRDIFVFLFALLVIVAFVYTIRKTPEKLVNRDQTEEWKGWMQVSLKKQKNLPFCVCETGSSGRNFLLNGRHITHNAEFLKLDEDRERNGQIKSRVIFLQVTYGKLCSNRTALWNSRKNMKTRTLPFPSTYLLFVLFFLYFM